MLHAHLGDGATPEKILDKISKVPGTKELRDRIKRECAVHDSKVEQEENIKKKNTYQLRSRGELAMPMM